MFPPPQSWNVLLFPLLPTPPVGPKVVPPGLFTFVNQFGADIPALLAAVLLSALPIFAVYLFARRALINGLMGVGGR